MNKFLESLTVTANYYNLLLTIKINFNLEPFCLHESLKHLSKLFTQFAIIMIEFYNGIQFLKFIV